MSINLDEGDTCTYQVETECGLPAFEPSDTTGFDIELVDYDEDDLTEMNVSIPPRNATKPSGDRKGEFGVGDSQKLPKPPKNQKSTETSSQKGKSGQKGVVSSRFDPSSDGKKKQFKGGNKDGDKSQCKRRF